MRRTIILAAALAIIMLGLWGTAVILFDEARLKSLISGRLSEQVGRRVEIVGGLEFDLFPRLSLVAENVVLGRPRDGNAPAAMHADRLGMNLRLLPLLQGELAAGQVQLDGAVINLRGASGIGQQTGDPVAALRAGARLFSGRSLHLRDVRLLLPKGQGGGPAAIAIDLIELDRFSLDQSVTFRFHGDLGDPALLEAVKAQGRLYVPESGDSPVRLRNLDIAGRIAGTDERVSLSGELAASGGGPFRISLAGGQLQVAGSAFDLSFNMYAGPRPALDLLFSGPELDWGAVRSVRVGVSTAGLSNLLAALSARVDLRSQVQLDVLRLGTAALSQVRIDLRSRRAGLGATLAGGFPGGVVEASGTLQRDNPQSLVVDISLASMQKTLDWLGLPPAVEGSGEATLSMRWPHEGVSGYELDGGFELWDGRLALARAQKARRMHRFDSFSGRMRITPGYLEIPAFQLAGETLSGSGWAALELPDATLGGVLRIDSTETPIPLRLFGSLAQPRLGPHAPTDEAPGQAPSPDHEDL